MKKMSKEEAESIYRKRIDSETPRNDLIEEQKRISQERIKKANDYMKK